MRALIGTVSMNGVVVIGEGEKDEAPMLFNGERVGDGSGPECDVAVDPIDGTRLTAMGMNNALSVLAVAERGTMYDPSAVFYMDKLVTGPEAADVVDIRLPVVGEHPPGRQGQELRRARRHRRACSTASGTSELAGEIRATGARIKFLTDGDVAGAIMAATEGTGVDLLMGVGGTPEGIITACAIKCIGGKIQGRLWPTDDDERAEGDRRRSRPDAVLSTDDLVRGDNCFFVATGITDGELLRGVRYRAGSATTHSLVMRSKSGTKRLIESTHALSKLRSYSLVDFD